jgi:hypothetical protein
MKCEIEGCKEPARWIAYKMDTTSGEHTNDTYLCPEHFDAFKATERKIKQDRLKAGIF